jgi:hypothetical protein
MRREFITLVGGWPFDARPALCPLIVFSIA